MLQSILVHVQNIAFGIGDDATSLPTISLSRVLCTSGVVVAIGTVTSMAYNRFSRNRHIPPGPPSLPILGNVLQVPRQLQSIPFMDWCYKYGVLFPLQPTLSIFKKVLLGPIISLNLLGQRVIILNNYKIASDLIGKQRGHPAREPKKITPDRALQYI